MLTIGQMSKACSVTVKTLRHYDKIGLLRACEVDRFTGYRYYSEDQIGRMLLIDRLKRYGFSLSDIQGLMQISDPGRWSVSSNARGSGLNVSLSICRSRFAS